MSRFKSMVEEVLDERNNDYDDQDDGRDDDELGGKERRATKRKRDSKFKKRGMRSKSYRDKPNKGPRKKFRYSGNESAKEIVRNLLAGNVEDE